MLCMYYTFYYSAACVERNFLQLWLLNANDDESRWKALTGSWTKLRPACVGLPKGVCVSWLIYNLPKNSEELAKKAPKKESSFNQAKTFGNVRFSAAKILIYSSRDERLRQRTCLAYYSYDTLPRWPLIIMQKPQNAPARKACPQTQPWVIWTMCLLQWFSCVCLFFGQNEKSSG